MRWDKDYRNPEVINDPSVIPAYGVTDEERAYWNQKQDPLEYDAEPTPYSDKHLISGAIYNALEQYKVSTVQLCQDFYWGIAEGLGETKQACEDYAAAALQSETNAAASEGAALISKNAAAASATSAAQSAYAATESKNAAASSAANATASATAAANSASSAATSATNAAGSATEAASSIATIQAYAEAAAGSATAAAGSATAASNSASAASISEINASSSATAASGSATAAAASETAAAGSATAASGSATAASGSASNSLDSSRDSEAWATGQRNGVDVPATDPTYHNNAKYYAALGSEILQDDEISQYTTWSSSKLSTQLIGKADLVDGKVPAAQLPSYVDDVEEYASTSVFPATGETGKIYVALDTNKTYRWGGTGYVEVSESLALGETASTAYPGNLGKATTDMLAALQAKIPETASESNQLAPRNELPTQLSQLSDDSSHRLVSDADIAGWNNKAAGNHNHDDRYYTKTNMDAALAGKSNTGHTHDDRYYTETEINNMFNGVTFTTENGVDYINW